MTPVKKSILKLRKLKDIRRKNLEKNFLEIQMKGQDHYVFIKSLASSEKITVLPAPVGMTSKGDLF